jgi:predicted MPP superfamily phosphohydrolase
VVFLGDLFDDYSIYEGDPAEIVNELSLIEGTKLAVWGNHDMGGGAFKVYEAFMTEAGFIVLENQSFRYSDKINFVGASDYIYTTPQVGDLYTEGFDVLLAHEPVLFDAGYPYELQLSGHTHGGQINLPFITKSRLPRGSGNYISGVFKDGERTLYVNRGLGMSNVRARFLSVPEITVIEVGN